MNLLHLCDWNYVNKYYEVPRDLLLAFKELIERSGINTAWEWFTQQVDYSADASEQNKPIKRVDVRADHTLNTFFLDFQNPLLCVAEWNVQRATN